MGYADNAFSKIHVGRSTTAGGEPTTYYDLGVTGHDLTLNNQTFSFDTISSSRKPNSVVAHSVAGSGTISGHWSDNTWDDLVQVAMADAWATSTPTATTVTFAAAASDGSQVLTATAGNWDAVSVGDMLTISDAVDPTNNGSFPVIVKTSSTLITIYNPQGAAETSDAVTIGANEFCTVSTTKSWACVEREFYNGSDLYSTEHYIDQLVSAWSLEFSASSPSRTQFSLTGPAPTLTHGNGSTATANRGGADSAVTTAGEIHGMGDFKALCISSVTGPGLITAVGDFATAKYAATSFSCNLSNAIGEDPALGTNTIVNTRQGRSTATGSLSFYNFQQEVSATNLGDWMKNDVSDAVVAAVFAKDSSTAYCVSFTGCRITAATSPIQGSDSASLINVNFSGTDMRVTRQA